LSERAVDGSGPWQPEPSTSPREKAAVVVALGGVKNFLAALFLRVCLRSLSRIAKLSQHEANARKSEEGERIAVQVLKIFG
jgi:hypothetical protein